MVDEQRRLLGLPLADQAHFPERTGPDADTGIPSGTVASLIADRLECAVLASRQRVSFRTPLTKIP